MRVGETPLTVLVAHPSAELYGSDKMLLESVIGLISNGLKVIVTVPTSGPLVQRLREHGATVVLCAAPVLRKKLLSPLGLLILARESVIGLVRGLGLLIRHTPDVIYVSTLTLPLWPVIAKLTGRPSVVHVHEAEGSAARAMQMALAAPLCISTSILVNSEYSANVQEQSFKALRGRTTVVHNGVAGPPAIVEARHTVGTCMRLLYVGRLSHRKGVDVAILAVSNLRSRGLDVTLDIVGEVFPGNEKYKEDLRALVIQHHLGDLVNFHGFKSEIWPYLNNTDVCLVTSRFDEPFGNTAVEALLAARPLLVSDTSGLREAAAGYQSSIFVTPGDPKSLADGVETIHSAWGDYRRWAELDAGRAADKHSLETYRTAVVEKIIDAARRAQ